MKFRIALWALLLGLGLACNGRAQGTLILGNHYIGVDAPVFDTDGVTPLAGSGFGAQFYVATQPDQLAVLGDVRAFGTGLAAGYIKPLVASLPGIPGGTRVYVELRAWEFAAGPSYEEALAEGGRVGASPTFSVVCGNAGAPPSFPADLIGLQSFSIRHIAPPQILQPLAGATFIAGQPAALAVVVEGTPPLTFTWFRDGVEVQSGASPTLAFGAVTLADAGRYSVTVRNSWGEASSGVVGLDVLVPPALQDLALDVPVLYGESTQLAVVASGSTPLTYRWFAGLEGNTANPVGADSPVLLLPTVVAPASYWVRVSNAAGAADSETMRVSIVRHAQVITFSALPDRVFDDAPFPVVATASSGLPVALAVESGPAALTGNSASLTGIGVVKLMASQAGSDRFLPAGPVSQSFAVTKGSATISFAGLSQVYDGTPKTTTATTLPAGLKVNISYDGLGAPPINPGNYAVSAVVDDAKYQGSATATLVILGGLKGLVFEDQDGNGRQDEGEAGLAGVGVRLFESNGAQPVAEAASDANGRFAFTGLAAGTYVVEKTDPEGYVNTTPNRRTVSLEGVGEVELLFGNQRVGTVSGLVYDDANGNGQRDPDETGLAGVQVSLAGATTQTTTTAADGSYAFSSVPAGGYSVEEVDPSGYASTTPNQRSINLGSGAATASFGDRLAGVISGTVFEDWNGDGVQDSGEAGLVGVLVRLSGPAGERDTRTDNAGQYSFGQLPSGTYEVEETDPPGFGSSTPNQRTVLSDTTVAASASFGDHRLGGISGLVFDDANGNGQRDASEPGIGGVLVKLSGNGLPELTERTRADGSFRFDPAAAGVYTVTETDATGFVSTTPNIRQVNLGVEGAGVASFGDQAVGRVAGTVFNDLNGNGTRDPGEPGLGGVTVQLLAAETQRSAQTTGDGLYVFEAVTPGTYTVIETDPTGFTSSTPNNRQVVLPAGGAASVSFGDLQVGTIAGVVFDDRNGNGLFEPGEPGIPAVTVTLRGTATEATAQTTSDGSFSFANLTPGAYSVTETDPAGFASTSANERVVSLTSGGAAAVNFGDQPLQTVVGTVFEDQNGNGRQESGEPGISDVRVELLNAGAEQVVATTVTSATGGFVFADLTPGDYVVRQVVPAGYTVLLELSQQSLAGPATGPDSVDRLVTIESNGAANTVFPTLVIGTLTGVVFEDLDGNGQLDVGEQGIGGVSVDVHQDGQPAPLRSTVSAGNGSFVFDQLPPQTYTIRQQTPPGYYCPAPFVVVDLPAGGAATAGFADQRVAAVSGRVFHDENADGLSDPHEVGIGGVVLTLTSQTGAPRTTASSGDGAFVFPDVASGTYTLEESDPDEFSSSTPNRVALVLLAGQSSGANFGDVARPPRSPTLNVRKGEAGSRSSIVRLAGELGRTYTLEQTSDFKTWKPLDPVKNITGNVEVRVSSMDGAQRLFYRARVTK